MATNHPVVMNVAHALAHLLTGQPGRTDEIFQRFELVVAGALDSFEILAHFLQPYRMGRPLIVVQPYPENRRMPMIGVAANIDGKNLAFEECLPWLGSKSDRAHLIPSTFEWGSFRITDELELIRDRKPPRRNYDLAAEGVGRGFRRYWELEFQYRPGASNRPAIVA